MDKGIQAGDVLNFGKNSASAFYKQTQPAKAFSKLAG